MENISKSFGRPRPRAAPTSAVADTPLDKQDSQVLRQQSGPLTSGAGEGTSLKKVTSSASKKQEEWDKEIPPVSLLRVMALNAKEWWLIVLGVIGAAVAGSITPLFAIIFGEILSVFASRRDEIRSAIALWSGMFLVLGFVSGIGIFLKVDY